MRLTRLTAAAAAAVLSLTALPLTSSAAPISVGGISVEAPNHTSAGKNYVFTQNMDLQQVYNITPEDTITFDNVYVRDPSYVSNGNFKSVLVNGTYRYYASYIYATDPYAANIYDNYWYGISFENVDTGELLDFDYGLNNWEHTERSDANYYSYFAPQGTVGASIEMRGLSGDKDEPHVFTIKPYENANTVSYVSATLGDSLDMNFIITNVAQGTTMTLSGPNGDISLTYDQYMAGKSNSGEYQLTYPLNATQADEKLTLSAEKDGEEQLIFTKQYYKNTSGYISSYDGYDLWMEKRYDKLETSLSKYLEEAYDRYSDSQTRRIITSLQNYTKAASNYFNGTALTVSGISNVSISDLEAYAPVLDSQWDYPSDPKENAKLSLVLDGKTELRMYWDYISDDDQAYIYEDENLQESTDAVTDRKGDDGYFAIPEITPKNLSKTYILEYSGDYFKISPLSYAYRVLLAEQNGDPTATPQLVDLAKALYIFAMEAAKA
ncbi:MAG TPA: hypothetical protein DCZ62_00930 [Ruminococcus sp.]|nr:hypothetical protein [Ruminococcus sp.]